MNCSVAFEKGSRELVVRNGYRDLNGEIFDIVVEASDRNGAADLSHRMGARTDEEIIRTIGSIWRRCVDESRVPEPKGFSLQGRQVTELSKRAPCNAVLGPMQELVSFLTPVRALTATISRAGSLGGGASSLAPAPAAAGAAARTVPAAATASLATVSAATGVPTGSMAPPTMVAPVAPATAVAAPPSLARPTAMVPPPVSVSATVADPARPKKPTPLPILPATTVRPSTAIRIDDAWMQQQITQIIGGMTAEEFLLCANKKTKKYLDILLKLGEVRSKIKAASGSAVAAVVVLPFLRRLNLENNSTIMSQMMRDLSSS
jgi:hypothetical protein